MSEAQPTATTIPETPAQAVETPTPPENGKLSFDEQIRTDPEFALKTVKNFQRKLNEAQTRLRPLEQLEQVARATFGDVSEGVSKIVGLADRAYRIEQNPQWKQTVEDLLAGKPHGAPAEPDYQSPEEQKIKLLEGQLNALRDQVQNQDTRVAQSELTNRLSGFFTSELGQALSADEKAEVVETLQSQFKQWSATEGGRSVLRNLQPKTIETVVLSKLHEDGKLAAVYDRIRQSKDQHRLGAATDRPSSLPVGASAEQRAFKNSADALRHAAKELLTPEDRQRLGW